MPITSTTTNCHQIIQLLFLTFEPCHEKTYFCHMRTTMWQISLCICPFAVRCPDSIIPLVSISKISSLYLASVAAQAGLSVTKPEDRFSRDEAHFICINTNYHHNDPMFLDRQADLENSVDLWKAVESGPTLPFSLHYLDILHCGKSTLMFNS